MTKDLGRAQIIRTAEVLRSVLGIAPEDHSPDLVGAFISKTTERNSPFEGWGLVEIVDSEMDALNPDAEAYIDPAKKILCMRERALCGARRKEPRFYFAFAHEIAHIWSGHAGNIRYRASNWSNRIGNTRQDKAIEKQANELAALVIMPPDLALRATSEQDLMAMFPVSATTARIHWEYLQSLRGRKTPSYIQSQIDQLKKGQLPDQGRSYQRSALSLDQQKKLLWEIAPEIEGCDPREFRTIDGRYTIRWSRYGEALSGGWRVVNNEILCWDDEKSR